MKQIISTILAILLLSGCAKVTQESVPCTGNPPHKPMIPDVILLQGNYTEVYGSSGNGATYQWTGPNNFTYSANPMPLDFTGSTNYGKYTVVATVNGCASAPDTFTVGSTYAAAPPCTISSANYNKLVFSSGYTMQFSGACSAFTTSCYGIYNGVTELSTTATNGLVFDFFVPGTPLAGGYYQLLAGCDGNTNTQASINILDAYGNYYYISTGGYVYCNTIGSHTYITLCGASFTRQSDGATVTVSGNVLYL